MPSDRELEKKILQNLDELEDMIKNCEDPKEKFEALEALEKARKILE